MSIQWSIYLHRARTQAHWRVSFSVSSGTNNAKNPPGNTRVIVRNEVACIYRPRVLVTPLFYGYGCCCEQMVSGGRRGLLGPCQWRSQGESGIGRPSNHHVPRPGRRTAVWPSQARHATPSCTVHPRYITKQTLHLVHKFWVSVSHNSE